MTFDDLQDMLPVNLRVVLPLLVVAIMLLGNLFFILRFILPGWSDYLELSSQIDSGETALEMRRAEEANSENVEIFQRQIESRKTGRAAAAADLLTEDQANHMLDQLFTYAAEAGVEITSLQAQQTMQVSSQVGYEIREFRLQLEGEVHRLLEFVTRFREATVPGVTLRGIQIKSATGRAVLTLEVRFYASPFASGSVFNNLPPMRVSTSAVETGEDYQAEMAPENTAEVEVTSVTYLAAPLPLNLLFRDTFDAGVLYVWEVDSAWSFVSDGDGQALQVSGSSAPVTFRHRTLMNAAVQIRFKLDGGSARLSLRESDAGSYTGVVDPDANEVRLYRGDILVRSVPLSSNSENGWHTAQLSAIDDIIRLVVDGVEYIAIRYLARLPPGTTSFALVGDGHLRVDDFMLWTLRSEGAHSE